MKYKWMEHLAQAWDAFIEEVFSFVPEETKTHIRNARKEMLLALKSIIEKRIEELEKPKKEIKKVKVEKAEA
jgi:molecular chaperone DnaK (HSP70)